MDPFPAPGQHARAALAGLAAHGDGDRFQRLDALERLWHGRYAEGRPSFWDTSVPLRERAPAVQSMLPRTAGRRLRALVFGARTFPALAVEPAAYGVELTEAEVSALSALVQELAKRGRLVRAMRAVLEAGLKCGSACAIVSYVQGRPVVGVEPAKHCTPTLDDVGAVTRLVIQKRVRSATPGKLDWYRRELGDGEDRVYARVPCEDANGRAVVPDWPATPVVSRVKIPFVPAVWVRNLAEEEEGTDGVDGHALAEGLEDEVAALDLELSQLLRNALYNGDPQMVQVGVDEDADAGRKADPDAGTFAWASGWLGARVFGRQPAKRRGPGSVWKLPSGGDAKLVESSGAGAQIIKGAIDELRRVITDGAGVVLADPAALARGDLSAKALQLMLGPMLDTASDLQGPYGDALLSIVDMWLRLAADPAVARGVYLVSLAAALPVLRRLLSTYEADGAPAWLGAPLALRWPDAVEPTWQDVTAAVNAASVAVGGRPVLSQRAAVRLLAPVVGVEDLDAELEAIGGEEGETRDAVTRALGGAPDEAEDDDAEDDAAEVPPGRDSAPPAADPDAPEVTLEQPAPPRPKAADTALDGEQIESLLSVVQAVASRRIPRGSGLAILARAFGVDADGANAILDTAGASFVPAAPPEDRRDSTVPPPPPGARDSSIPPPPPAPRVG